MSSRDGWALRAEVDSRLTSSIEAFAAAQASAGEVRGEAGIRVNF